MTILFDFNRTLFDPEKQELCDGALPLLSALEESGATLYVLSRIEVGRPALLDSLGIRRYFVEVLFVEDKRSAIQKIVTEASDTTYVVGDHLHDEIRIGNTCGARTVWVRHGKFADLKPEGVHDVPWRTVRALAEVHSLLT